MTATTSKSTFHGVHVPIVTPMDQEQNLDLKQLAAYTDVLIDAGIHGLTALGSTGEYYALSPEERTSVLKTVLDATDGRIPVLAGTNAASTREVIAYSQQAQEMGAAGLLLAAPYYSLPQGHELLAHFQAVNDAVDLPIMLYNYPGRTGVDLVPELVEQLAELSHVVAIKESTGDVTRIHDIMRRCGDKLDVFCGADTIPLESFTLGAVGWVGGIANVLPKSHVKLYDLAVTQKDADAAREFYFKILPALDFIENSGMYTQLVKAGCGIKGHPAGPPRQPLLTPPADMLKKLKEVLVGLE